MQFKSKVQDMRRHNGLELIHESAAPAYLQMENKLTVVNIIVIVIVTSNSHFHITISATASRL